MLVAYVAHQGALIAKVVAPGEAVPSDCVWLDLVSPTQSEDELVERAVGVEIPTRDDMQEIEPSSRLYVEDGARYMTLSLLCGSDTETPSVSPVTFILINGTLVTVRYSDPKSFGLLADRLKKSCPLRVTGEIVLVDLLESVIDRTADALEQCGASIERLSKEIFERKRITGSANQRYRAILVQVGRKEGLTSYARESLASLSRLMSFLGTETDGVSASPELRKNAKSMARDVNGLSDYATFLANKLQFLLDGTIGMVSLEQNNIIKIFAVLSVIFMPPTLIASIYGMNFEHMPELSLTFGYPVALGVMVVSAITPYIFFKWRGWL